MKISHFLLAASISFVIAFAFSCSSGDDDEGGNGASSSSRGGQSPIVRSSSSSLECDIPAYNYGTFDYEGKTYRTVTIGEQTWMADNLNNDEGGKCYNNDPANCEKYGRLYTWTAAMDLPESCNSSECASEIQPKHRGICPLGWHVPSNDDWNELLSTVGGAPVASTHLKAVSCWYENGNGQDTHKFAALPGGCGDSADNFYYAGFIGYWWSADEQSESGAFYIYIRYDDERTRPYISKKEDLYSIRCIQD
jgi:uncharacterized protein (TIGR02145 family)